jgi:hypothetical protein
VETAWAQYLERRIGSVLASIPGQTDLRRGDAPSLQLPEGPTPEWMRIPIWLDQAWSQAPAGGVPGGPLAEVVWGQYALFLTIRIQDDLFDRQRDDLRLLYVADRFLLESMEAFQRVPGLDAAFWSFYRGCLRETVDGILETGRLEREAGQVTAEHLRLHARVSAIFKVGAAAVCRLHGHDGDMAWLAGLQDQTAIVSQIGDDLEDVAPDLEAGRFTWVGNTLLAAGAGETIAPDERARRLAAGFMRPERGAAIVAELRRAVRTAAAGVPESAPRPIRELVQKLDALPGELEQKMHEARVRSVFGEAVGSGH